MFKEALWSRSLVWCSECLLKHSPFLHSLYGKSTDEDNLHKCPLLPVTLPFLFLFGKDPGVLCPYKHLFCQPLTDSAFFDSGPRGTAFLTPAEWIMQKKSTHFTAGCQPKHQGLCYSVVVVAKIDQMKWGEQQGRKQNSWQSRANFLHGFVSPSVSSTWKIPWAMRCNWPWQKTKKWCLWGCKRSIFEEFRSVELHIRDFWNKSTIFRLLPLLLTTRLTSHASSYPLKRCCDQRASATCADGNDRGSDSSRGMQLGWICSKLGKALQPQAWSL